MRSAPAAHSKDPGAHLCLRQIRSAHLDQLLNEIDARRDLARRELDVLDELQEAAIGGLIDGTLTLTTDELTGQEQ